VRIANLLKAWRHHEELSIREAAERIGIPASTLAGIEGGRSMSADTLAVIWRWTMEKGR